MTYQGSINFLPGDSVLAEYGPMRLVINASIGHIPQRDMAVRAAEESFKYLERMARLKHLLAKPYSEKPSKITDSIAIDMVKSVLSMADKDLTPMAAVAGAMADGVADFLLNRGMTRVIVENGGDVAIRLKEGDPVTIGIRPDITKKNMTHVVSLDSIQSSWGVATSGLGGRSLTRGVASAVTVFARTASIADAAATAIANASAIDDDLVIQEPAEKLDPNTDIPGTPVTVSVGQLSEDKKQLAISNAMKKANELLANQIVFGAFVAVLGKYAMTPFVEDRLTD